MFRVDSFGRHKIPLSEKLNNIFSFTLKIPHIFSECKIREVTYFDMDNFTG
jgi:hypothetical protein